MNASDSLSKNLPLIIAGALAFGALVAVTLLAIFRPDSTAILVLLGVATSTIAPILAFLSAALKIRETAQSVQEVKQVAQETVRKVEEVHLTIDGRMTQLLAALAAAAKAEVDAAASKSDAAVAVMKSEAVVAAMKSDAAVEAAKAEGVAQGAEQAVQVKASE